MNKTIATRIVTCLVALTALSLILGSSCKTASLDNTNPSQGTGQSSSAVVLSNAVLVTPSIPVWCWAATISEVLNFFGLTNNQCQAVSLVNHNDTVSCCPANTNCVAVANSFQIQNAIFSLSGNRLSTTFIQSPLNFSQVQTQINNGRPIIVLYQGFETSGHVALIFGYDSASQEVFIHDPLVGQVLVPFGSTFNYNGGQLVWTETLTIN